MRKVWLCIFYAAVHFYHRVQPVLDGPAQSPLPCRLRRQRRRPPSRVWPRRARAGQSGTDFYLCDEGGRVVVYTCSDNGLPDKRLLRTGIYVNLLPEADALRLKQGLYVTGETALRALLEDLGE